MKNSYEHIDLIERYLYDDMTKEELEEFNEKLRKDPEFNKLFYEMDHLLEGIRQSAKHGTVEEKLAKLEYSLPFKRNYELSNKPAGLFSKIIESINQFMDRLIAGVFNLDHEEMVSVPVNSRGQASVFTITGRIKLIAASSIVIIFLTTIIIITQFSQSNPVELYADNFEKPELLVVGVRSTEPEKYENLEPENILNTANLEFNNSNFGQAIGLIEQIPDEEKMPGMKYCGALSYMEIEKFERAKELLMQLGEENDIVWQERSKWLLALCFIHEEDKDQAVKYLKEVSQINGGVYQEQATLLLKKVNK